MADTTQQVTSQIPITSPSQKNPKRVAAGKAIAEKRRQAREEQNKNLAEADAVMAKERLRKAEEEARKTEALVEPPVEPPVATPAAAPPAAESNLTTTQWLSIASIIVSLAAIYYKREEIKGTIAKIKLANAPAPVAPANEPVLTAPKREGHPVDGLIECFSFFYNNDLCFYGENCGSWRYGSGVVGVNM